MHAVWHNADSALQIFGFLGGPALVAASRTCRVLRPHGDEDGLWRALCMAHGFKQRCATRSRGTLPWRAVYAQNLCAECHAPGSVVLNLEARSSRAAELLALCDSCYGAVHAASLLSERLALLSRVVPEARRTKLAMTVPPSKKRKGGAKAGGLGLGFV